MLNCFYSVWLFVTLWTIACKAPLSMWFFRQELWRGLPSSKKRLSSGHLLSRVRLFATPWIAAFQASLSITNSRSSLDSCPSSQWCHPAISSSVVPFCSCPESLPASESFPMSQLFAWGSQRTGISPLASFPKKKSRGRSPSEWTDWIFLQSKGFSRVFSTPQFKSINSSALSLLHSPTLTSIHDHRKNHSLD